MIRNQLFSLARTSFRSAAVPTSGLPAEFARSFSQAARRPPSSRPTSGAPKTILYVSTPEEIYALVSGLIEPVTGKPLSMNLAVRALTHKSLDTNPSNTPSPHNEKLTFFGRRVLRLHLALHLRETLGSNFGKHSKTLSKADALPNLIETVLLGEKVGSVWKLEKVLQWRQVSGPSGAFTGLYKARGSAVEALLGAVFIEQGIEASSQVFQKLVLPHLRFELI